MTVRKLQKFVRAAIKSDVWDVRRNSRIALTEGAGLPAGAKIEFAKPRWASGACVEGGEVVLYTQQEGLRVTVR